MKKYPIYKAIAFLSILGFALAPHFAHADITSNLLIHYKFEDNAANTTVIDSQGTSNGTADVNTNALSATGRFGNAFLFDAATTDVNTNYVWSASDPDFTISAWVKATPHAFDNWTWVSSYAGQAAFIGVGMNNGDLANCQVFDTGSNSLLVQTSVNVGDGYWHFVVCVLSGTSMTVYVDGLSAGTNSNGSLNGDYRDVFNDPILIAKSSATFNWPGYVDELRIYNRALSSTDVNELGGLDAGLFGYWKFDEGSGTVAADSSENGNTGTLNNGDIWTTGMIGSHALSQPTGIGGSGGYVSTPNTTSATQQDISYSAWVYPIDLTGESGHNIFMSGTSYSWLEVDSSGHFAYEDRVPASHTYTGTTIPLNAWTMLTVTCHDTLGAADVVTMYINGAQVQQDVGAFGVGSCYDNNANQYYLGTYAPGPGHFGWTGYIDDARVYYGRALSGTDVTALYALGFPAPPPPPTFHSFITKIGRLFTIKLGNRFQIQ